MPSTYPTHFPTVSPTDCVCDFELVNVTNVTTTTIANATTTTLITTTMQAMASSTDTRDIVIDCADNFDTSLGIRIALLGLVGILIAGSWVAIVSKVINKFIYWVYYKLCCSQRGCCNCLYMARLKKLLQSLIGTR